MKPKYMYIWEKIRNVVNWGLHYKTHCSYSTLDFMINLMRNSAALRVFWMMSPRSLLVPSITITCSKTYFIFDTR